MCHMYALLNFHERFRHNIGGKSDPSSAGTSCVTKISSLLSSGSLKRYQKVRNTLKAKAKKEKRTERERRASP